jgi:hypothetical protein
MDKLSLTTVLASRGSKKREKKKIKLISYCLSLIQFDVDL